MTERCSEAGCDRPVAVRVFVPWEADRNVCLAHGRAIATQEGVVAEPLGEWIDDTDSSPE